MTEYSREALMGEIDEEVRKTALVVLSNLVVSSPVDTGRFRGNWQIGIDMPKTSILNTDDKSGGITISAGAGEIGRVRNIDFESIFITNNMPYGETLNNGSSTQAPAGFVESAIRKGVNR